LRTLTSKPVFTEYGILELTWQESATQAGAGGVPLREVIHELQNINTIVGLATAISLDARLGESPFERAAGRGATTLKVRYGSPLFIELDVTQIVQGVGALAFLIFALKRIWGLDLEIMAHREEMRGRYLEAKERAEALQARIEETKDGLLGERTAPYDLAEHELDWGEGSARAPDGIKPVWKGSHAKLRVDD
jgi:hypothetical protein